MPAHVEKYRGYRIAIYSPSDHHGVMTLPGSKSVMDLRDRIPRSTAAEGRDLCLQRAKVLIDELMS